LKNYNFKTKIKNYKLILIIKNILEYIHKNKIIKVKKKILMKYLFRFKIQIIKLIKYLK
jgi:hypothetical protein